jgi:hypothetical protein
MDEIQYNQLLDLTYEAAVNLDLWPKVLERVACAAGAWSAALIQQNEVTGEGQGIRANTDPAATQLYYGVSPPGMPSFRRKTPAQRFAVGNRPSTPMKRNCPSRRSSAPNSTMTSCVVSMSIRC